MHKYIFYWLRYNYYTFTFNKFTAYCVKELTPPKPDHYLPKTTTFCTDLHSPSRPSNSNKYSPAGKWLIVQLKTEAAGTIVCTTCPWILRKMALPGTKPAPTFICK